MLIGLYLSSGIYLHIYNKMSYGKSIYNMWVLGMIWVVLSNELTGIHAYEVNAH